eukprot:366301-Chlamydomonas_euryale.AAC.19
MVVEMKAEEMAAVGAMVATVAVATAAGMVAGGLEAVAATAEALATVVGPHPAAPPAQQP